MDRQLVLLQASVLLELVYVIQLESNILNLNHNKIRVIIALNEASYIWRRLP